MIETAMLDSAVRIELMRRSAVEGERLRIAAETVVIPDTHALGRFCADVRRRYRRMRLDRLEAAV